MQGYAQTTSIDLPLPVASPSTAPATVSIDLTVISRRSIERPGLRMQRRGVDSKGAVANFVETEFISQCRRDGVLHISAFVQTRGSSELGDSFCPRSDHRVTERPLDCISAHLLVANAIQPQAASCPRANDGRQSGCSHTGMALSRSRAVMRGKIEWADSSDFS